jgi:hypothetical protein
MGISWSVLRFIHQLLHAVHGYYTPPLTIAIAQVLAFNAYNLGMGFRGWCDDLVASSMGWCPKSVDRVFAKVVLGALHGSCPQI